MPRAADDMPDQGMLFAQTPPERALAMVDAADRSDLAATAASLHPLIHLGTSSWTFPGWSGLVYSGDYKQDRLARHGLAAYAHHPLMRTVGLDRAFYTPPDESDFRDLAGLTPPTFRFVVKAHQALTRPDADERGGTFGDTAARRADGIENPRFLDAEYARDIVISRADRGLGQRLGVILFQFPPLDLSRSSRVGPPARLIARLEAFLRALPPGPCYAVEIRNRELLSSDHAGAYARCLRECGVLHGYVHHPTMPTLDRQARIMTDAGWAPGAARAVCVRWLLRHDQTYEGARERYQPFREIIDEDPPALAEVARLLELAVARGLPAFVVINNKAEGSAPRSVERLAQVAPRQPLPRQPL